MNLIIVDDDIYIVRALQRNIDWKAIGIDEAFIAFNTEKAREIFHQQKIDILVTDIEMPRESGLELVDWVRQKGYECKIIYVTGHGDFQYAQKAIRFRASGYLLKPVDFSELSALVYKMTEEIRKEQLEKERREKGTLWEHHQNRLEAAFWMDVLRGSRDASPESLSAEAKKVNLNWDFNQQYQLVLFSVKRIYERKQEWNEDAELMQYIICNIAQNTFLTEEDSNRVGWLDRCHMCSVILAEAAIDMQEKMESFIVVCEKTTGCGIVAYMDEVCYGEELPLCCQRLLEYDKGNVTMEKGIFDISFQQTEEEEDLEFYRKMRKELKARQWVAAVRLVDDFWDEKSYRSFQKLVLNISAGQYEIYRCLEENQISVNDFWNDELLEMAEKMRHLAGVYKEWLKLAIGRIEELCSLKKVEKKVIAQIEEYVDKHLEERISRENIARAVCFSTDYISKLFKKETGISLSEYIIIQKINRAKKLLTESEESIGNIAIRLGYNSFSYFSEIFRKQTGILPSEYKRLNQTE